MNYKYVLTKTTYYNGEHTRTSYGIAVISTEGYNAICEFLGANWYALVGTAGLAVLVLVHFVYAFILTIQNRRLVVHSVML